ncbi:MAG: molybdenum cofactor guanylyltransferase, partial [Candidatus Hermodarchaeota archaeon]
IKEKLKNLGIAILIGGKSTRFGTDKGLFKIFNKPLISYEIDTLSDMDYNIFLVAHSVDQVQNYIEQIDFTNITAFIIDNQSPSNKHLHAPIIGLFSTFKELKKFGYKKVLVLSCDTPLLKKELLNYLIEQSKGYDCCIPQWENGFLEPLLAIYPIKKALKTASKSIKIKSYKLTNLLSNQWKINFISVEKSLQPIDKNLDSFTNINELKDIEKIREILKNSNFL